MAYERFRAALEACEFGEDLSADSVRLFVSLFENCPPNEFQHIRMPYSDGESDFVSLSAVPKPETIPSLDLLARLRALDPSCPPYVPDADQHSEELIVAMHIKAAILLLTWMHFDFGDDVQPTQREVEQLLKRWEASGSRTIDDEGCIFLIASLSERVDAELCFQAGWYDVALLGVEISMRSAAFFADGQALASEELDGPWVHGDWAPPWLYGVRERAKGYV